MWPVSIPIPQFLCKTSYEIFSILSPHACSLSPYDIWFLTVWLSRYINSLLALLSARTLVIWFITVYPPATALETGPSLCILSVPSPKAPHWYPHRPLHHRSPCSVLLALTVYSIVGVLVIHSFISVPNGTQHVEPYHIPHTLSILISHLKFYFSNLIK